MRYSNLDLSSQVGAIEWKYGRDVDDVGAPAFVALDISPGNDVVILLRDDSQIVGIDVSVRAACDFESCGFNVTC